MIDGSVLQSAQRCFEKKSRVVVQMVVTTHLMCNRGTTFKDSVPFCYCAYYVLPILGLVQDIQDF